MTAADRRVVMTGAAGRIGRAIAPRLAERWRLTRTDVRDGNGIHYLDITDLEACRRGFDGADAVVHLAAVPDPDAAWDALLPVNLVGAYQVAQAAVDLGVRRLVLASSLHAVSAGPDGTQVRARDQARPANLYGASKAWAEALGSWVSATSSTSAVALRIGYFSDRPPGPDEASPRERSAWLSSRDATDLVRAAVEAHGVDFFVANGISANRYRFADLQETMDRLSYRPVDDAWSGAPPDRASGAAGSSDAAEYLSGRNQDALPA